MEKKKIVKPVVIAASVAAIVGIGAVSFAAWTGDNKNVSTQQGTTGSVTLTGFANATDVSITNAALVPYDQTEGLTSNVYKMATVSLPKITSDDKVDIKVTVSEGTDVSLYVQLVLATATAPTAPTENLNDWNAIGSSGYTFKGTGDGIKGTDVEYKAYIVLSSNTTGDMGKNYTVNFELVAHTA